MLSKKSYVVKSEVEDMSKNLNNNPLHIKAKLNDNKNSCIKMKTSDLITTYLHCVTYYYAHLLSRDFQFDYSEAHYLSNNSILLHSGLNPA